MRTDDLAELRQLASEIGPPLFGSTCSIEPLEGTDSQQPAPADATAKGVFARSGGRRLAVVFLSNQTDPDMAARNARKARQVRDLLGEDLGCVVLNPLKEGVFQNRSFVVWPWCSSWSRYRLLRLAQRKLISLRAMAWLRAVARHTLTDISSELRASLYDNPLQFLIEDTRMDSDIRRDAEQMLQRIESAAWHPKGVLEHNDLWLGNLLLPRKDEKEAGNPYGFIVIDWGGSSYPGHPVFDVLRFCSSAGISPRRIRAEIRAHMAITGSAFTDALGCILAGVGTVGLSPGHFPEERYLLGCRQTYARIKALIA